MSNAGEHLGIEVLRTKGSGWSRPAKCAVALALAACGAFTYRLSFDMLQWRGQSHVAREVASKRSLPSQERWEAILGATRDARLTIELLRDLEQSGEGEVSNQARLALEAIQKALK